MSGRFDWEKARKKQLVWLRGPLPSWQDGWAPWLHDKSGDLKIERKIDVPKTKQDFVIAALGSSLDGLRSARVIYRFTSVLPGHERRLLSAAQRLWKEDPPTFVPKFDALLVFDYSIHSDGDFVDDGSLLHWQRQVRIRPKRKKRPPEFALR
jgi:hypothetical protein